MARFSTPRRLFITRSYNDVTFCRNQFELEIKATIIYLQILYFGREVRCLQVEQNMDIIIQQTVSR